MNGVFGHYGLNHTSPIPYEMGLLQYFVVDYMDGRNPMSMYVPIGYTNNGTYIDFIGDVDVAERKTKKGTK